MVTRGNWQLVRRPQEQVGKKSVISPEIVRLGRKPREYADALLFLVKQGSQTAEQAWLKFQEQAEQTQTTVKMSPWRWQRSDALALFQ